MKSAIKPTILFLFALLVFPLFFSCQEIIEEDPLLGTWDYELYQEQWIITESEITYLSPNSFDGPKTIQYKADIISRVDSSFNGNPADTTLTATGVAPSGEYGYLIIQFTEVANSAWGTVGKYDIFRWQSNLNNPEFRDFTQGINLDNDFNNIVFDSAESAQAGATNSAGYFAYASAGAARE
jgi:hypothetical protein